MERKSIITKLKKLESVPNTLSAKQDRGLQFERLIADLFEDEEILLKRPYHTCDNKSEQIDGAIRIGDRIFLLEIKWVESGLAASDLYAFIGKVDNKMFGTLGLFISKEKLGNNFIEAVSKGRQRKIIIIHGESVEKMCSLKKEQIKNYLNSAINIYSFDNESYYSIEDYLGQIENNNIIKENQSKSDVSIKDFVLFISNNNELADILILEETEKLNGTQKMKICEYFISNYAKYYKKYSDSNAKDMAFKNINVAFNHIKAFEQQEILDLYLNAIKNEKDIAYFLPEIWGKIKNNLKSIDKEKKKILSLALQKTLSEISGDYNKENIITECIIDYWDYIEDDDKTKIITEYIEYFYSSRELRFPQRIFANKLITTMKDPVTQSAVNNWINNKIVRDIKYLKDEELTENVYDQASKYFCKNYKELASVLGYSPENYKDYIKKIYIKNS